MAELSHRRLRAPTEDGAALVEPALGQIPNLIRQNRELAANRCYDFQGQSLEELTRAGRASLASALDYTAEYRGIEFVPMTSRHTILMAGHQPELFHAGVWFKNFLLSSLAEKLSAVAINLIVDTDTVRSTSIRVPVSGGQTAAIESLAFDASTKNVSFEEQPIRDRWLFESFGQRVMAAYRTARVDGNEPYQPLVESLWQAVLAAAARKQDRARLGQVIAEGRHVLESLLGLKTLECPLSRVAQTQPFRRFIVHLLVQMPRLRQTYNAALAEYRHANRIRSVTHPFPGLGEDDDWLESPFFVWTTDHPNRRHLWVKPGRGSVVLSDREDTRLTLDVAEDGPADKAIEQLAAAESRGIKVRPRALITTMYARLFLSDLFIHGIGGAKYDELTDLIIRRFFGIEPPAYVTATATFRLPIERPDVTLEDVRKAAERIRDTRYRPESLLRDSLVTQDARMTERLAALAAEKRDYLARHDLRRAPRGVFEKLDRLNRAMHALLRPVEEELRAEQARLVELARQARVLGSREFSFVLFPSEILPARLLDLCKVLS